LDLIKLKKNFKNEDSSWLLFREKQKFSSDLNDLLKGKKDYVYSGKPIKAIPADLLRILAETHRDGAVFLTLRNLLINSFVSAESKSAVAGLAFMLNFLHENLEYKKELKRFGKTELEKALLFYLGDGMVMESCLKIFENIGHDSTISFDVSHLNDKITVRLKPSFSVNGCLHDLFSTKNYRISGAKVICIDGILESISNVDSLIRTTSSCKLPLIIIARGYDADFINTLNYNHQRGLLNAYPFVVHAEQNFDVFKEMGMDVVDVETYFMLNKAEYENLFFQSDFMFDHEKLEIAVEQVGGSKTVEVLMPKRLMPLSGIIEDRMLSGLSFCKEATFSGLVELDDNVALPAQSLRVGKLVSNALQKQLDGLASIIYLE
jgi:hypothetical protein